MTERTCGECYRCCVAFGIPELNKYQDQAIPASKVDRLQERGRVK
jgi:hypothetical protein